MFVRQTVTATHVIVAPTRLSQLITWLTRNWWLPTKTLTRDFGTGCFDKRCLLVKGKVNVIVCGNLIVAYSKTYDKTDISHEEESTKTR